MMDYTLSTPWNEKQTINKDAIDNFLGTINDPEIGFYHCPFGDYLLQSKSVKDKIKKSVKKFVHVGLGGSSLGPEMLIKALQKNDTEFIFLNNIDPVEIKQVLDKVEIDTTLFYIVSKSGTTAETMAIFSVIVNFLDSQGIDQNKIHEHIVFCTDPEKGDLRSFASQNRVQCLEVPSDIGGRFSVFTPVGFFPALFADIDLGKLIQGIKDFKTAFESNQFDNKWTHLSEQIYYWYQNHHIDQTVLMPYSYQLKDLSLWFVQLWAESLGKEEKGLTPIYAYGASDQHSQVQLFMQGPKNKCVMFIEIENRPVDFELASKIELNSIKKMNDISMATLLRAELRGTELALAEQQRPFVTFKMDQLNEANLGALVFYFQCLTTLVGNKLEIDPFNQPGVEAGKIFAWKWIAGLGGKAK